MISHFPWRSASVFSCTDMVFTRKNIYQMQIEDMKKDTNQYRKDLFLSSSCRTRTASVPRVFSCLQQYVFLIIDHLDWYEVFWVKKYFHFPTFPTGSSKYFSKKIVFISKGYIGVMLEIYQCRCWECLSRQALPEYQRMSHLRFTLCRNFYEPHFPPDTDVLN